MANANLTHDVKYGVRFAISDNNYRHSYDYYGFYMGDPKYDTKKRKQVVVSLPYANGELDFSNQFNNQSYFEACDVTYKFFRRYSDTIDMYNAHKPFEDFCWSFKGDITDDYGMRLFKARCTSFVATPHISNNVLEVEVTFRGTPNVNPNAIS